jgi:hypothetical protein
MTEGATNDPEKEQREQTRKRNEESKEKQRKMFEEFERWWGDHSDVIERHGYCLHPQSMPGLISSSNLNTWSISHLDSMVACGHWEAVRMTNSTREMYT